MTKGETLRPLPPLEMPASEKARKSELREKARRSKVLDRDDDDYDDDD